MRRKDKIRVKRRREKVRLCWDILAKAVIRTLGSNFLAHPQLAHPQLAHLQLAHPQLAHPQLAHPQLADVLSICYIHILFFFLLTRSLVFLNDKVLMFLGSTNQTTNKFKHIQINAIYSIVILSINVISAQIGFVFAII